LRLLDYRKTIEVRAYSIYILHNAEEITQKKELICGPVDSFKFIEADKRFYEFQFFDHLSDGRAKAKKYKKMNLSILMKFEANGEKTIEPKIEKLKIFIKPHIFLMIFELFTYGMPVYSESARDKPNFYDADYGNAPRMEICCQILQSLLCFENDEEKSQWTIACQGNVSFTFIRHKENEKKAKLVQDPDRLDFFDNSAILKVLQLSISDLCPFFCLISDLEGKNFKQVKKREMISPFTLFYNKNEVIELAKAFSDRSISKESPLSQRYVFKRFNRHEGNIEKTLLKISFGDLELIKGIIDYLREMLNKEYIQRVQRLVYDSQSEEDDYEGDDYIEAGIKRAATRKLNEKMETEDNLKLEEGKSSSEDGSESDSEPRQPIHKLQSEKRKRADMVTFSESIAMARKTLTTVQRMHTYKQSQLDVALKQQDSATGAISEEEEEEDVDEGELSVKRVNEQKNVLISDLNDYAEK